MDDQAVESPALDIFNTCLGKALSDYEVRWSFSEIILGYFEQEVALHYL